MLFTLLCTDKPGALDLRMATRSTHLAYLQSFKAMLVEAGPMLDLDGKPCGSVFILEAADREAAAAFAAGDPYAQAGLFESSVLRGFRHVFKDGVEL
jgi:uncharacterized protein YciI